MVSNYVDDCTVEGENDLSRQFLQLQKNQLIDSQEHFERYCNTCCQFVVLTVQDIKLVKWFLLPIVNEQQIETTVIKNANQFVSYNFGDVHLLDLTIFLAGATSLDSLLKAYKTEETENFSPMSGLAIPKS